MEAFPCEAREHASAVGFKLAEKCDVYRDVEGVRS